MLHFAPAGYAQLWGVEPNQSINSYADCLCYPNCHRYPDSHTHTYPHAD